MATVVWPHFMVAWKGERWTGPEAVRPGAAGQGAATHTIPGAFVLHGATTPLPATTFPPQGSCVNLESCAELGVRWEVAGRGWT